MIADHDRSGWFGASDVGHIMGRWDTKTFSKWWMQKIGLNRDHFTNDAMAAGTNYEHAILDAIGAAEKDKQIFCRPYLLRINLDGNTGSRIHEVKTHRADKPYKPTKAHVQQVQVQMFAAKAIGWEDVTAEIVAYGLLPEEYGNFFLDIDMKRIKRFEVAYDPAFINQYLKRIRYLGDCLLKGVWPDEVPN